MSQDGLGITSGVGTRTAYATAANLEDIYGPEFLVNYTDDTDQENSGTIIANALEEAHEFILSILLMRYDEADLRGNTWVIRRECYIAGYILSTRRGQSPTPGIQQRYSNALDDIDRVMAGRMVIPGAPARVRPGPNIINQEIDNRYTRHRQRRLNRDSTNDYPGSRQSLDELYGPDLS